MDESGAWYVIIALVFIVILYKIFSKSKDDHK